MSIPLELLQIVALRPDKMDASLFLVRNRIQGTKLWGKKPPQVSQMDLKYWWNQGLAEPSVAIKWWDPSPEPSPSTQGTMVQKWRRENHIKCIKTL